MNELYWITRLNAFNAFIMTLIVICIIALIFIGMALLESYAEDDEEDYNRIHNKFKDKLKYLFLTLLVAIPVYILAPSEKQALMIYGVGGTIDYVKSNEKVKKLPDKCVDALDKFMDKYIGDNEDERH